MVRQVNAENFLLKTSDPDEALQQAAAVDAVIDAPNKEVALAQMQWKVTQKKHWIFLFLKYGLNMRSILIKPDHFQQNNRDNTYWLKNMSISKTSFFMYI